jgi:hypothetical protein
MTWSLVGWAVILLAAVLLVLCELHLKKKIRYTARHMPAVERLKTARVTAVESGQKRQVILGHRLWSHTYPGLGLKSLFTLPIFVDAEEVADGGQAVSISDGSLLVLARQVIHGRYQDGFSEVINEGVQRMTLPGATPFSFTMGIMDMLALQKPHSLALLGDYGSEAALWAASAADRGGDVFAAAGSIESQAVLFLGARNLLIGEEIFFMPGSLEPAHSHRTSWLVEDILRVLLTALLLAGVALKLGGML